MKLGNTKYKKKARIEIIPLIDIMFFLLATFVLVSFSMTENRGLLVNLPVSQSNESGKSTSNDETITISILENGGFAINKRELDLTTLKEELKSKTLGDNSKVVILGDQGSKLQDTISILDLTKELNIQSVTLRTKSN